jgi:hypothetical protein
VSADLDFTLRARVLVTPVPATHTKNCLLQLLSLPHVQKKRGWGQITVNLRGKPQLTRLKSATFACSAKLMNR